MLKNYFKIIFRNLAKNKFYTAVNLLGLAVGICAATLITLFIVDEVTYDDYHEKKDRIYRLTTVLDFNGVMDVGLTNMAVGPTLQREYPEVESFARFYGGSQEYELTLDDKRYKETNIWFTDSTVFDVFTYPLLHGNPQTALSTPNALVLTQSVAEKIFGTANVLGEQLKLNNTFLTIQGVMKDPPENSEIPIKGLISVQTLPQQFHQAFNQDWFRVAFYTFILMKQPTDPAVFKPKLDEINQRFVVPWADANGLTASHDYQLTPLPKVHFDSGRDYDLPKGNLNNVYMFAALAVFLLLIAAFNFINLNLAQQEKRKKEVGIRKTLGANQGSLIQQFLFESLCFTAIAMIVGLALAELFLEPFNHLCNKSLVSADLFHPAIILMLGGVLLFLGILAGSYPAFVLASLKPVTVLSGGRSTMGNIGLFRKGLILLQFLFSIFMISATLLIGDQMSFLRNKNLGFDRENLISIDLPADTAARNRIQPWIEELNNQSGVVDFTRSALPTGGSGEIMFRVEKSGVLTETGIKCLFVDENFVDVLGLNVLQGRNFSREFPTDQSSGFIVNETAAQTFGWGEEPLNKRVQWNLMENGQAGFDGHVVGMVNDFHFMSLHNELEPLILCYNPNGGQNLAVRMAKGDYTQTLAELENSFHEFLPGHAFDFTFFDEDLEQNYVEETKTYQLFSYFSGISILLACLGLFALLSYAIQARAKEIGIRKVLGANTLNLSWVIVKDFFWLLCIAMIISTPLVYFIWKSWQADFAYKAPFEVGSFVYSFLITLGLAALAVVYHSFKIAKSDPVYALREE